MLWRASERSIVESVRHALELAAKSGFESIAFPIIGAGSGGFREDRALELMRAELGKSVLALQVVIVRYRRG